MVTRPCAASDIANKDMFVYREDHVPNAHEEKFMEIVFNEAKALLAQVPACTHL